MGVEQALVQKIICTAEEAYLVDIRNRTTKPFNDTVADVINRLQDNYGQLMPHALLKREEIVKKTTYYPRELIVTIFSTVKKLLKFSDITRTLYTQL